MRALVCVLVGGVVLATAGCRRGGDPCEALGSCPGETGEPSDPPGSLCTSRIRETLPAQGATDVFYRGVLTVSFTERERGSASFVLRDGDGAEVSLEDAAWSDDGKGAILRPTAPLAPSTPYVLAIGFSCDDGRPAELAFTTDATGSPVDPDDFAGRTYALDLSTAVVLEPPGAGTLVAGLLDQLEDTIVVVPSEPDPISGDLDLVVGLLDAEGAQDACTPTTDLPSATYLEDPYFAADASEGTTLAVAGVTLDVPALALSGAFAPDGDRIDGIELALTIDTRPLVEVLGDQLGGAEGDDAVCNLLWTFTSGAVRCGDGPTDGEPLCLDVLATGIVAEATDAALDRITAEDVAADPGCAAL